MKDLHRSQSARHSAEKYAPAPVDTHLMYGVVAASMTLVATIAAAAFYGLELGPHLPAVAVVTSVAFVAGLLIRFVKMSRHRRAYRFEYDGTRHSQLGQPGDYR